AELGWAIVLAALVSAGIWLSMSPVVRQVPNVDFAKMLLQSGCIAMAAGLASTAAFLWSADSAALQVVRLAIGMTSAAIAFLAAVFVFKHPLREELHHLHKVLRERRVGPTATAQERS
ncbi:MAG: hypothetical protein H7337_22140, partial [Rhizobacter sp.]|nr:hypothetical protein [Rhizobacter sp.]